MSRLSVKQIDLMVMGLDSRRFLLFKKLKKNVTFGLYENARKNINRIELISKGIDRLIKRRAVIMK